MAVSRESKNREGVECPQCCPVDLHDVNPEQRKLLQNIRHQHFLRFVNQTQLSKHLRMVYPPPDDKPMIDAIQNWYSKARHG